MRVPKLRYAPFITAAWALLTSDAYGLSCGTHIKACAEPDLAEGADRIVKTFPGIESAQGAGDTPSACARICRALSQHQSAAEPAGFKTALERHLADVASKDATMRRKLAKALQTLGQGHANLQTQLQNARAAGKNAADTPGGDREHGGHTCYKASPICAKMYIARTANTLSTTVGIHMNKGVCTEICHAVESVIGPDADGKAQKSAANALRRGIQAHGAREDATYRALRAAVKAIFDGNDMLKSHIRALVGADKIGVEAAGAYKTARRAIADTGPEGSISDTSHRPLSGKHTPSPLRHDRSPHKSDG